MCVCVRVCMYVCKPLVCVCINDVCINYIAASFFLILYSHYLYSISHPSKSGVPLIDLKGDVDEGQLTVASTPVISRVAQKALAHYGVKVNITENVHGRFKSKLWRMGQLLDKHREGNQRAAILKRWEEEEWELFLDRKDLHKETIQGMLKRKDDEIALEATKRIKLDQENKELMKENKVLKDTVNILTQDTSKRSTSRKNWICYSKKQQRKRRELKERVNFNQRSTQDSAFS